jgi:hypothetical protein
MAALVPPTICWQRTSRAVQMYGYKFRMFSHHCALAPILEVVVDL